MSELQRWTIPTVALHPTGGIIVAINQADFSPWSTELAVNKGMRHSLARLGAHPQATKDCASSLNCLRVLGCIQPD